MIRCHRLSKECRPAPTTRRRNYRKPIASKTAQLEEKIDGLMSIFNSQPPLSNFGDSRTNINDPNHDSRKGLPSYGTSSSPSTRSGSVAFTKVAGQAVLTPGTSNFTSNPNSPADVFAFSHEPVPLEAEEYLNVFRSQQLKYFPFVHIPYETSADQLQQKHPFLWLCIMSISSKSVLQQQALSRQIKNTVAQRLLHESECSIDLLLGLLAFIGW
jgi:hypothetical protein